MINCHTGTAKETPYRSTLRDPRGKAEPTIGAGHCKSSQTRLTQWDSYSLYHKYIKSKCNIELPNNSNCKNAYICMGPTSIMKYLILFISLQTDFAFEYNAIRFTIVLVKQKLYKNIQFLFIYLNGISSPFCSMSKSTNMNAFDTISLNHLNRNNRNHSVKEIPNL
ncbi:hypothetical protein H8356DRAFT_1429725 [Neocallimastix lanati (nom. inval.)]|nr:hypothetical protein H8356DRAFT_1429725 [Neocallimastix sp. JGI-2020a]